MLPHHGSHALVKTLHREMIITIASHKMIIIQTIAPATAPNDIIASGLIFPVSNAHEKSKEKFICIFYIDKSVC
jgi:hypothetical protein